MEKPLVSILIASYNKEKYLKRCLESCLKQTYKNIEMVHCLEWEGLNILIPDQYIIRIIIEGKELASSEIKLK